MYDYTTLYSDYSLYFGLGILALLFGFYKYFIKHDEDKISYLVAGICFCVFFCGFGIADYNAAKSPDIEIYVGEYIEHHTAGTGSNQRTTCVFDSHDGSLKRSFHVEDIEYFLIPEKGKWYEIHYVANSNHEAVVKIDETEPPEYNIQSIEDSSGAE